MKIGRRAARRHPYPASHHELAASGRHASGFDFASRYDLSAVQKDGMAIDFACVRPMPNCELSSGPHLSLSLSLRESADA